MLNSLLGFVEIGEKIANGLKVDVCWIDGKPVPVISGSFKKGQGSSIVVECEYQRPNEQKHKIKAISAKGSNNNVIEIDGQAKEPISIKIEPDAQGLGVDID